jgi:thiol-disulfide isomerase/thioredoxin
MSVVAYHFWSPTCAPCKYIKPAVEDLKEEFSKVSWVSVNTQDDKEGLAIKYNVSVVPTIVVECIVDDKVLVTEKQTGTNMTNYYRIIRTALKTTQLS